MKQIALASLALLSLAQPAAALDFTGPVAPGNWTVSNIGALTGGSPTLGSATFTPTQLVLTGSNSLSPNGDDAPGCSGGVFQVLGKEVVADENTGFIAPDEIGRRLAAPHIGIINYIVVQQ